MTPPAVSVVIPFCDRYAWTLEAIQSVLAQTFQDFEILLVDDASTEAGQVGWEAIDGRITLLRHDLRRGPAAARNTGIAHAHGEFIAFLDSDDAFLPEKLETQLGLMRASPSTALSYTGAIMIDEAGHEFGVYPLERSRNEYPYIWETSSILTPCVMVRTALLDGLRFDEGLSVAEDTILWARIARLSTLLRIELPLSRVRFLRSSTSVNANRLIGGIQCLIHEGVLKDSHLPPSARRRILSTLNIHIASCYWRLGVLPSVARHIAIAFWNFPLNPLFLHLAVQHTFLRRYIKVGYSGSIDVPAAPAEDDLTVVRA